MCQTGRITQQELDKARKIYEELSQPKNPMAMMMSMGKGMGKGMSSSGKKGGKNTPSIAMMKAMGKMLGIKDMKSMPPEMKKKMMAAKEKTDGKKPAAMGGMKGMKGMKAMMGKMPKQPEYSKREKDLAFAIMELERTIKNVALYKTNLLISPRLEFESIVNAMNGGFTMPSPTL